MDEYKIPSISSLHREKHVKQSSNNDIYKTVLNKCIEKIVYTNRHTDKTFIIFEVPKLLIGHTSYDMISCIHYIINNISVHGYIIQFIEPFYIYIDWGSNAGNSGSTSKETSLQSKTRELLRQFPNVNEIEYVYEDVHKKKQEKKVKRKKRH